MGSFSAILTARNIDPAAAAPLVENSNASSFKDFHQGNGWEYVDAPGGLSTYLYVWNWPLGFPVAPHGGIHNCLVLDEDNDLLMGVEIRNYSLQNIGTSSWSCDTDGRKSQNAADEVFLYAC